MRGLGDVIAAATSAAGIKPCAGCKKRQEALNRMVPFTPQRATPEYLNQMRAREHGPERKVSSLRNLHVVLSSSGAFCLDLNLRAPTLKELHALCIEKLKSMRPDDMLPVAPDEEWLRLFAMKLVKHYWLNFPIASGGMLGVTTLQERT